MAAGIGSRYGGIKQIEPVGAGGETIMEFSIYDALRSGFDKIVFVIKNDIEEAFRERIYNRVAKKFDSEIVYQELYMVPDGVSAPDGRVKPWGTGHAVLCAKNAVSGPFSVINADDFYGRGAFAGVCDYITKNPDGPGKYNYCMAGYRLENTVTEAGYVSRGVCASDGGGFLTGVTEITHIVKDADGSLKYKNDNDEFTEVARDSLVSMNMWGFQNSFMFEAEKYFNDFFAGGLKNPLKDEFYLPSIVNLLLAEKKASVKIIPTPDKWYGFTYKEDMESVQSAIKSLVRAGKYPERLWD